MASADLGEVTIEYEIEGDADGEPMLLVMGLGTQMVAWPLEIRSGLVDAGFRVIRLDNRDVGLSSKTTGPAPTRTELVKGFANRRAARSPYVIGDMAADALALLDHLGIERAHLVGVSMGGMIAQQLTIDHQDRVLSLCSIMSNTGNRRHGAVSPRLLPRVSVRMTGPRPTDQASAEEFGVEAFRTISGPHFNADEVRLMVRSALERDANPLATTRQLLAISASPDRTAALAGVHVPTLVIHGLADQLVLPSGGVATARAIPGSRLLMFPDMAHDLPAPRRAEIVEAITANARRALR